MKELLQKIKTDPVLKAKVVRSAIFFGLFVIGVIVFLVVQSGNSEPAPLAETTNKIDGRIIPADTTSLNRNKQDIFKSYQSDSIIVQQANSSNVLGGSVVEQQQQQQQSDNMLNDYMASRQKSIDRMQNSGSSSNTYVSPTPSYSRRSYNPSGKSSDWTSEPTTVTGTRITGGDQPVISAYARNYNPDNPSASLQTNLTPVVQPLGEQKPLTKEEKLQQAIAQKYGRGPGGSLQGISVSGMIYQNQKINGNNTSVRILLSEKINLGDATIGTDAFVFGMAQLASNAVNITVPSISYKGRSYQVNLEVYDARTGERGIPVKADNIVGNIQKQAESEVQNEISKYTGRIGQIATSVLGSRNRPNSISLNQGHRIFLKSK